MKKRISARLMVLVMMFVMLFNVPVSASQNTAPSGYTPIYSIADLYGINNNLSGKYILMNDIDMSSTAPGGDWDFGNGWNPIGYIDGKTYYFNGVFDGNGYKIKNMYIYGQPKSDYLGLFACIGGRISNLALENIYIDIYKTESETLTRDAVKYGYDGYDEYDDYWDDWYDCCDDYDYYDYEYDDDVFYSTGGLCGKLTNYNYSTIEKTYVSGSINSGCNGYYGGICGEQYYSHINDCYAVVGINVLSDSKYTYTGGICGYNNSYKGYISNCYSLSNVTLNGQGSSGAIIGCGDKGEYLYYLSGNGIQDGATALNTFQMKSEQCFTGFDFNQTWVIDANSPYPYPQLRSCPQERPESISLRSLPNKLSYKVNEKLDLTGAMLDVLYEGSYSVSIPLTEKMCVYEMKKGYQSVTVNYLGFSTSFGIEVGMVEEHLIVTSQTSDMKAGDSFNFAAEYTGDESIQFFSSNTGVLSIDKTTGKALAIKAGTSIVTIKAGEPSQQIEVTVEPLPTPTPNPTTSLDSDETYILIEEKERIPIVGIHEEPEIAWVKDPSSNDDEKNNNETVEDEYEDEEYEPDFEMEIGESFKLAVKKVKSKTFVSSDKSVVTVSKKGKVKAIGSGVATVTVMDKNSKKVVAEYIIEVLSEEEADFELEIGETMRIALKKGYTLSSSDSGILKISGKGKILGIKQGLATVTVKNKSGKEIESYLVEVTSESEE